MGIGFLVEASEDVLSIPGPIHGERIHSFVGIEDPRRGPIPPHQPQIRTILTKPDVGDLFAIRRYGRKESVFTGFSLVGEVTHLSRGKIAEGKVSGGPIHAREIPTIG